MNTDFPDALSLPRHLLRLRGPPRAATRRELTGGATAVGADGLSGGAVSDVSTMMEAMADATRRSLGGLRADPKRSLVVPWGGLWFLGEQGDNSLPSKDDRAKGRSRLVSFTKVRTTPDAEWATLPVHWQAFVSFRP